MVAMLRRLLSFRAPRPRPRWLGRHAVSRQCVIPLLVVFMALFLEAWVHVSHFTVRVPESELDTPFYTSCQDPARMAEQPREKAALVMLARNKELDKAVRSIESVERHFNRWFHYPIVFLNDEPWSEDFMAAMRAVASGETRFEVIPREQWTYPGWMDVSDAQESIRRQGQAGILYAGMETYHHMCRFYSKNFYQLEALKQYKWYWRIEPDIDFHCAITYDPFREMARNNKVYGFTIALPEEPRTCPSLFREMSDWKEQHRIQTTELWKVMIAPSWMPWPFRDWMAWFSQRDRHGDKWSMCHYWSNFEIADLDFFRRSQYKDMVEYLDRTGKFYYERWGDAAVHSLAVAMLLDPQKVHHFADFGYRHDWYFSCPNNAPGGQLLESTALGGKQGDWIPEREGGIGCRCECDGNIRSPHASYCLNKVTQPNTRRRLSTLQWLKSWYW